MEKGSILREDTHRCERICSSGRTKPKERKKERKGESDKMREREKQREEEVAGEPDKIKR